MKKNLDKIFIAALALLTIFTFKLEKPIILDTDQVNIYGSYSKTLLGEDNFKGTVKLKDKDITLNCEGEDTTIISGGRLSYIKDDDVVKYDSQNGLVVVNLPQHARLEYTIP